MATQTGSIELASSDAIRQYAEGQYATAQSVTNLSTVIEQHAEAIALRATKTEFNALEIGGRETWYADWPRPVTAVELGYLSEKKYIEEAGFIQDFSKKFCMRVDFMRSSSYQTQRYCLASSFGITSADTGFGYPEISIELRGNTGRLRIYSTSDDGDYSDKDVGTAPELDIWSTALVWWDPETKEITWLLISGDRSETGHYAPSGTYSRKSGLVRLGADNRVNNTWNVKYYQRDMPPIWYEEPPEDPKNLCRWSLTETVEGNPKSASSVECSSGNASIEAAKSEIKATTDGITSTVEKISSAKYLDTICAGYSLDLLKQYSAEGHADNWRVTDAKGTRVGDTVYLRVKDTTRDCYIYVKATVNTVNGNYLNCTSHGYEDVLPVDTIKSTINQSSDSVKIKANHLEIDGTAIFSNTQFQTKLTETLDAIEVGGRNLLLGTATQDVSLGNKREGVTETSETWLGCKVFKSSGAWSDIGFDFETQVANRGLVKAGDVLTYSIWAKTDDTVQRDIYGVWMGAKSGNAHMSGAWIAKLTNSWTRYEKQITITQAMLDTATVGTWTRFECNTTCTSGKYIYWAAPKLEKGNKATDWSPAPEDQTAYVDSSISDISIGGRNLFKSTTSVQKAGTGAMTISAYDSAYHGRTVNVTSVTPVLRINNIIPETNVPYTISFTCTASAACRVSIDVMDNAVQSFDVPAGTSKVVCTSTPTRAVDSTYHFIDIQFGAVGTYKLEDIMVEQSTKPSSWSPAPEDTEASIEAIEQGLGGFDILWNRANFSTDVDAGGECYLCAYDPTTATRADTNGWAMWNGAKRIVAKGMFNPNAVIPYNIPVYIVCRLSSATATTGTNYMVWYDTGWKYATMSPSAVGGDWTWAETTDMVLGKFVEPGREVAFTECETYRQPLKWGSVTTDTVTARSAQALANTANTTANAAAPKTQAVKRTQRIYYRTQSNVAPATPGDTSSAWVTKTTDSRAVDNLTMANWSTKAASIASGTGANVTKYLYLWTCEQREMADGTLAYTNVLLDDSTTVIDGGNIITNSIDANKLNATDINASHSLTIGAMTSDTQSAISNENVKVGGRNLWGYGSQCESLYGMTVSGAWDITTESGYTCAHCSGALKTTHALISKLPFVPKAREYVTISGYVLIKDIVYGTTNPMCEFYAGGQTIDGRWRSQDFIGIWLDGIRLQDIASSQRKFADYISDSNWHHVAMVLRWVNAEFTSQCSPSVYLRDCTGDLYVRHLKYERGNKPTDWTPAPEDVEAATDAAAQTATNFITADSSGIWVTPSNAKPVSGQAASTTSGWHIADALELFRAGVSAFKVWVDETTSSVLTRIGATSMGHLLLEQSAVKLCDALDWVAKFSLSTNENGGEPIHTAALEINDGTEQGMHIGLNINHNAATNKYSVHMGTRTSGVGYSNGADGGVSINAPNVLLATDATATVQSVSMANFIHAFGTTLFTGEYSTTHASAVTLSETAANFSMLRIVYEDSDGYQGSVDVYSPDGKKFSATTTTATQTRLYIKSKSYQISGRTINCVYANNSYYRHAQMELGSGVTTFATSELIGIVRVIGFY